MFCPNHKQGSTEADIAAEVERVGKLNKAIHPINSESRQAQKEDELRYNQWVARDARLQKTILSSIEKPLVTQVRMCTTSNDMYKTLKDLNSNSDYANAANAWTAFVDLRADSQPSICVFIGKFRETINDLTVQNITLDWLKPLTTGATATSRLEQLLIIHFLHGLSRVLPQWVEARNNDLRQGHTWSIDTLIALLEDHIRHTPKESVKAFLTVTKQAEEKRVLSRLNKTGNSNNTTPTKPAFPSRNSNPGTRRIPAAISMCNPCKKEHAGPNDKCWIAHPELMPDGIKKRNQEAAAKKAAVAAARTNVTLIDTDTDDNGFYANVYTSIATFVSTILLEKAVTNAGYKKRYCYDTAANQHVFNTCTKFKDYRPILSGDVHGSTSSTTAIGVGTVCLEIVKYNGTTEEVHLKDALHCPDFATNVISQAPFKRHGIYYHSGLDKLFTKDGDELAYLPEIDGIPNFLVLTSTANAAAALTYASLHAFRSSSCNKATY
jgi:hypothetical protein